jgi:Phenylpropionate dioxygenase and related ring-hydroxylating dioxygenases, large terminal subunit
MSRTKTLSSDFYHSSSVFNQETENIFKNEWFWVGRSDQLTASGSYITTDLINYPIIIVRDNSNNLKAFHKVAGIGRPK